LENVNIPVPPVTIQQQIVERLDAVRKLQELNNKEIEKAEELFETLLDIKFRFNLAYRKFKLENMVVLKRGPFGGSLKKEIFVPDGYRVYEQRNAINDDFTHCRYFITEEKYKEMADFAVKVGDLIISCSGTIGKVALAPDNVSPGIINQALLRITPKRDIVLGTYLKYLIQSKDMQGKMFGNARGSSIKNIVSIKEIRKIAIHLPPIKEQQRIVKELDTVKEACEGKVSLQDKLSELFESTLNKAMKGELVNS
jgi:type I restriction enzyme S subunit